MQIQVDVPEDVLLRLIALWKRSGHKIQYLESALAAYHPTHLDLEQSIAEFLAECRGRNLRGLSVASYRETLSKLNSFDADAVKALLANPSWGAWARKHHLLNLRAFGSWCVRNHKLPSNPCDGIRAPICETKVEILSLDEVRRVVRHCQREDGRILPLLCLLVFGGLRWSEALKIDPTHIHDGYIEVTAGVSKTRSRRLVPLYFSEKTASRVGDVVDARRRIRRIFLGAGVANRRNVMRHTFASMLCAKTTKDPAGISPHGVLGHSETVLHRHYRALVSPPVADEFFDFAHRI